MFTAALSIVAKSEKYPDVYEQQVNRACALWNFLGDRMNKRPICVQLGWISRESCQVGKSSGYLPTSSFTWHYWQQHYRRIYSGLAIALGEGLGVGGAVSVVLMKGPWKQPCSDGRVLSLNWIDVGLLGVMFYCLGKLCKGYIVSPYYYYYFWGWLTGSQYLLTQCLFFWLKHRWFTMLC